MSFFLKIDENDQNAYTYVFQSTIDMVVIYPLAYVSPKYHGCKNDIVIISNIIIILKILLFFITKFHEKQKFVKITEGHVLKYWAKS